MLNIILKSLTVILARICDCMFVLLRILTFRIAVIFFSLLIIIYVIMVISAIQTLIQTIIQILVTELITVINNTTTKITTTPQLKHLRRRSWAISHMWSPLKIFAQPTVSWWWSGCMLVVLVLSFLKKEKKENFMSPTSQFRFYTIYFAD